MLEEWYLQWVVGVVPLEERLACGYGGEGLEDFVGCGWFGGCGSYGCFLFPGV